MDLGKFTDRGANQWYISTFISNEAMLDIKKVIENLDTSEKNETNNYLAGKIDREYWINPPESIKNHIFECIKYHQNSIKKLGIGKNKKIVDLNFLKYTSHPKIRDLSAWVNFQKKYEYNPMHDHTGDFSYAIWYKIPYSYEDEKNLGPGSKSNTSTNGNFSFYYSKDGQVEADLLINDKKAEGTMLIFPASLRHSVYPFFTSDEYRISFSGNIVQDINHPDRKKALV